MQQICLLAALASAASAAINVKTSAPLPWVVAKNTDAIAGRCSCHVTPSTCEAGVIPMGKLASIAACEAALDAMTNYTFFGLTYHNPQFTGACTSQCFGILDHTWKSTHINLIDSAARGSIPVPPTPPPTPPPPTPPPTPLPPANLTGTNFVVLFVDDMGYGDLSVYGAPTTGTPNIERMAREGTRFTQWYSAHPICTPSRAAMVTGRLPIRNGLCGPGVFGCAARYGLPANETTFARALQERGYRTAMLGKWHLGQKPEYLPPAHGFDYYWGVPYSVDMGRAYNNRSAESDSERNYYGCNPLPIVENSTVVEQPANLGTLTQRYTSKAVDFIRGRGAFAHRHTDTNTATSSAGEKSHSAAAASAIATATATATATAAAPTTAPTAPTHTPFLLYLAYGHVHTPQFAGLAQAGKSKRGVFGDSVEELDSSVGAILDAIRAERIESSTLVIYTSDNGAPDAHQHNPRWQPFSIASHGSNGPFLGAKTQTWEGGLREPGLMWMPGGGLVPAGHVCREHVSTLDVFATLMDAAGVPMPTDRIMDSVSILPLLNASRYTSQPQPQPQPQSPTAGGSGRYRWSKRTTHFFYRGCTLAAVRHGSYKLHYSTQPPSEVLPKADHSPYGTQNPPLLFQIEHDPGELYPVANSSAEYKQALADVEAAVAAHRAQLGTPPKPILGANDPSSLLCCNHASTPPCVCTPPPQAVVAQQLAVGVKEQGGEQGGGGRGASRPIAFLEEGEKEEEVEEEEQEEIMGMGTQTCPLPTKNATLIHLSRENVKMVKATAAECCALCAANQTGSTADDGSGSSSAAPCASWSYSGDEWTKATPCHLSPYAIVSSEPAPGKPYCGGMRPDAPPAPPSPPHPGPGPTPSPAPPTPGHFVIDTTEAGRRQVFEGIQVELMSDSIGSYNQGMPGGGKLVPDDDPSTLGAPHDLTPLERVRFATEVMKGVRTIRLAMGLYLRGLSADNKSVVGRWPSQMSELKQLQELSGVDGWAPEYWSPPPFWKSTSSYYGGTLKSFNESFLDAFSDAVVQDVRYLREAGLRVTWWGLQNEPNFGRTNYTQKCKRGIGIGIGSGSGAGIGIGSGSSSSAVGEGDHQEQKQKQKQEQEQEQEPNELSLSAGSGARANTYSTCHYAQCDYYFAFAACAKKIRQLDPTIRIHANSATGQLGASAVANDPKTLALVDAWTWHHVSAGSSATFQDKPYNYGKLDFTNEMEYQPGSKYAGTQVGTVSNVNVFMNTLTFKDSPTGVMMLHACKPTTNLESLGYGWTWWRSTGDNSTSPNFPGLEPNHWTYNWWNWNSVAPFVKTVPWNSVRRDVAEDVTRPLQRVVAFETPVAGEGGPLHEHTPAGKLIVVLTNEGSAPFNASIASSDAAPRTWRGYSFQGAVNGSSFNVSLGSQSTGGPPGPEQRLLLVALAPYTIQWWYEQ